ncbi:hypothetical protein [Streptomyces sp. SID8352]|uniref:hypothetical protein n=1 Tax=Streptomyces sp. SID8352 TaxID=2690338 RepID=UPI00136D4BBC|nr:hypothetical protein [Streptomyces sp. SID8352]MYU20802.1 hypothetical protein [Streptomyces sp. SID8352]
MTASPPKVNGHTRPPALQVLGDWQPIETPAASQDTSPAGATSDLVAQAQAEAIRSKAWAAAEEQRLAAEAEQIAAVKRAEAEAEAVRIKAEEEARKLRLANDRAERKAAEEQAASEARIAESRKRKADADRARADADRQAEEEQAAADAQAAEITEAEDRWRGYARGFYIVCAIVALPVQIAAFYNREALWLMAAPLMLEGGAWVVLKGAAAAVASRRPHWHYRLIAWLLAFLAAGINLWHGLIAFDPATAIGTAFASIAGPGVWDLHEHGRIRKRDGKPTWRERGAARKRAKEEAKQKAAEAEEKQAEKEAADKAAAEAAQKLAATRAQEFPDVWKHALRLAAALGETTVTEAIWDRAHHDIEGAAPGQSVDIITGRRKAEKRVEAASTGTPVNTLGKTTNAQRVPHVPPGPGRGSKTGPKVRGVRRSGDAPRFSGVARKQAAITAKTAAEKKG